MQQHFKEMNEIEDIMFAMEQHFEESEADARQEFHSLRDEIKNKVILCKASSQRFRVSQWTKSPKKQSVGVMRMNE